ncbi:GTP 3',8-cyclase MoaA [Clostridium botulinum]|nr:GTP 3',8-cyclase MoaA [Clostridium botulinum]
MKDQYNRTIDYLRISVTDRCNLRCKYCMPKDGVEYLQHDEILTFDEIITICKSMVKLGIHNIKITGGEPLVRKDIVNLIKDIKSIKGIENVTLTSNGILLYDYLDDLEAAGLDGINISLDTLDRKKYEDITRRDGISNVLKSIEKAVNSNIPSVKINCLIMKNFNENEILSIAKFAKDERIDVRFIEMMPIGLGDMNEVVFQEKIKNIIEEKYGTMKNNFRKIGFISAVSHRFCKTCNRIRITSDGVLKLCLQYNYSLDLKKALRAGINEEEFISMVKKAIYNKPKHHNFLEFKREDNLEERKMVQIGG